MFLPNVNIIKQMPHQGHLLFMLVFVTMSVFWQCSRGCGVCIGYNVRNAGLMLRPLCDICQAAIVSVRQ